MSANYPDTDSKPTAVERPRAEQSHTTMDHDDDMEVWESTDANHDDTTSPQRPDFDPPPIRRVVHSTDPDDSLLFHINDQALLVHDATITSPPHSKRGYTGTVVAVDRGTMTVHLEFWDHDGTQWHRNFRTAYFDEVIKLSHVPPEEMPSIRHILNSLHDNQATIPTIPRLGITVDEVTPAFLTQLPSSPRFTFTDSTIRHTL
jgi:hypothetical protein